MLWSSPLGGVPGSSNWKRTGLVILWLVGGWMGIFAVPILVESAVRGAGLFALPPYAVIMVVLFVMILRRTKRVTVEDALFLTPNRIIERSPLGNRDFKLTGVRSAHRVVLRIRRTKIVTDSVELKGSYKSFGPTPDADRVCELIKLLGTGEVDPLDLPTVAGDRSPAEMRTDVLIARLHRVKSIGYGILFLGPTSVLRVIERLPIELEAKVFHAIAAAKNASRAEERVAKLLGSSEAGYVERMDRSDANPHFEGDELVVRRRQDDLRITLTQSDLQHFQQVLSKGSE